MTGILEEGANASAPTIGINANPIPGIEGYQTKVCCVQATTQTTRCLLYELLAAGRSPTISLHD